MSTDFGRRSFLKKVCGLMACAFLVYGTRGMRAIAAPDTLEVDVSGIRPGEVKSLTWRGDPVFIRRLTEEQMCLLARTSEWVVVVGLCTHMGCVPLSSDEGWVCPCHDSHFDFAGSVLSGPARKNLVPLQFRLAEDGKMIILP